MSREDEVLRIIWKNLTIILLFALLLLSGCSSPSPPETPAEELVRHAWELRVGGERTAQLVFGEEELSLTGKAGGESISVRGRYYLDDKKISVVTGDMGVVVFGYVLEGDSLILSMEDLSLRLEKTENDICKA